MGMVAEGDDLIRPGGEELGQPIDSQQPVQVGHHGDDRFLRRGGGLIASLKTPADFAYHTEIDHFCSLLLPSKYASEHD